MLFDNQNYEKLYEEALIAKKDGYFGYKFRPKLPISNLSHFQRMKILLRLILNLWKNFQQI